MKNSKGTVYYGLHFYPGVAEYQEPGKEPYRVFLNEDTLRSMDRSFEGRPVYVMHVDGVDDDIDVVRQEADGWVTQSFFNEADGKHWVKFIVVSERGERAIKQGMRLSNCYVPASFGKGGLWNGVSYDKEITGGEYEHLAIVPNPRYEESVILTPDQFKAYNEEKKIELVRLANEEKETRPMALKLWNRSAEKDFAVLLAKVVSLPKSGKEFTIEQLANDRDDLEDPKAKRKANGDHLVEYNGTSMTLNELMAKHKAVCDELEGMKKANAEKDDEEKKENDDMEGDDSMDNEDDEDMDEDDKKKKENEDDADADAAKKAEKAEKAKNELEAAAAKKAEAKAKAARLRNAGPTNEPEETATVEFSEDRVARGKAKYGS